MAKVYEIDGMIPVVHPTAFVHPDAILIGDVTIGAGCYIGPAASLRGDFGKLVVEKGANIQDTCVMHGFPGGVTLIEEDGHIGHGAVIHGCRVGANVLIGINAVIMDEAEIGESSIVAALSFVKAGFQVPPRSLCVGSPARVIRELSDEDIEWKRSATREYQQLAFRSAANLRPVEPLSEPPAEQPKSGAGSVSPLHKTRAERGSDDGG